MRILSFDQGTLISGWAAFDNGVYISHGMIDLHKQKDSTKRIYEMTSRIFDLVAEWDPDLILLEDVVLMRSPGAMKMLAQMQGMIMGYCYKCGIPVEIYYPTAWRKLLGFKQARTPREELKQQAIDLVMSAHHLSVNSDEADAICIAMAHLKKMEDTTNGDKS